MEGKHCGPHRFDLLKKIGELTRTVVEDLCNDRSPALYIDQFSSYCTDASENCCCSYDLPTGKEILTLRSESQARRLDVLLRVLLIVQQLLQENKHGSKRDIYYMQPSVFKEQSVVDRAINDICILLQCSRHNLNVVSVGNGLVMGWLRFAVAGRKFDCINCPNTAQHVPVHVEDVEDIISVAEYVLIVEKESVFQRLANDKFCRKNRCIVITGRGYPDVPTRRFLNLLMETLHLPLYCLVDCDPYGIDILATFRFGSMQMAYDAKSLRLPDIRWLGAFPSDCEKYQLPQQCLLPLTAEDKRKAESLLQRCYMEREVPHWRFNIVIYIYLEYHQFFTVLRKLSPFDNLIQGLNSSYCWIEESNLRLKHCQQTHSHSWQRVICRPRSRGECTFNSLALFFLRNNILGLPLSWARQHKNNFMLNLDDD